MSTIPTKYRLLFWKDLAQERLRYHIGMPRGTGAGSAFFVFVLLVAAIMVLGWLVGRV